MLRALTSGVAGLKSHQTKMDVIGNNIANVNTYGFKASRVSFKDAFYQTIQSSTDATNYAGGGNPSQIGYGSVLGSIDVLHTRGGYTSTGEAMDLFISGEGYFVARDGNGRERYTRTGILNFDGSGNLVDANKQFICGYPIARYTEATQPKAGTLDIGGDINVDFGAGNGAYFNGFKIVTQTGAANGAVADLKNKVITVTSTTDPMSAADLQTALRAMTANPATGGFPADVTASLAQITATTTGSGTIAMGKTTGMVKNGEAAHNVGDIMFQTIPPKAGTVTLNNVEFNFGAENGAFFNGFKIKTVSGGTGTSASVNVDDKVITITTDSDPVTVADMQAALRAMTAEPGKGTLPNSVDTTLITVSGAPSLAVGASSIKVANGANMKQETILDKNNGPQMITKPGSLIDTDGDGAYDAELNDVMKLQSIRIGDDGTITGEDENGTILQLGQVVLANIPNPQALIMDGDSYMSAVSNTGEVGYSVPGSGAVGALVSGGLEGSNVDLANEFADMITTQRGFQANSRIITVGDEMLQELINLKR